MRLARIAWAGGVTAALVEEEGYVPVADAYAADLTPTGPVVRHDEARLLAPVQPRTVIGMAHNTGRADRLLPAQAFLKPVSSVIGPGEAIPVPDGIGRVDAEAEVAVVIGRPARHLTLRDAVDHVLGVTVANDVTARVAQRTDPLWTTAKGYDGFTPLGPWVVTGLDLDALEVALTVDGVQLRTGTTADLARSVAECLVHVTSFLTLLPGDVLLAGAPGEVGEIRPGQEVTAWVAGVGSLTNPVTAAHRVLEEVIA